MSTDSRVHQFYEHRIAQAHEEGAELYHVFDPTGTSRQPDAANDWNDLPLGVLEAYAFYSLFVMDQDWGSVGAYPVDAGGTPTVAVWTSDDGGQCWLEVYGAADGAFIASARSANGKVAWRPRDEIRKHVFEGTMLPEELLTPEQVAFYKNNGML